MTVHAHAFVPPVSFTRRPRLCLSLHRQSHVLSSPLYTTSCRSIRVLHTFLKPVAVQANAVSGDSDGEVQDSTPMKSYSVGVTVVSGLDANLRKSVIEKIVANSDVGRVVVVTMNGIASTEEPDGVLAATSAQSQPLAETPASKNGTETTDLNGHQPVNSVVSEGPVSAVVNNLEGWISCSSPSEMAEVVAKLAVSRECEYIVAEGSLDNSMEPHELAALISSRSGSSLRIDTLVSVLDSDTLLQDLCALPSNQTNTTPSQEQLTPTTNTQQQQPTEPIHDSTDTRPMMAVSLVENANVVIVNQSQDDPQQDQLSIAQNIVSVLNSGASIISATHNSLPVSQLVNTMTYNPTDTKLSATWRKVLVATREAEQSSTKPALSKSMKDSTFVYRAKRPFHPSRLFQQIKAVATFEGVIRSTGKIWLATRMLAPLEWDQAGTSATLRLGKHFWAAVPEQDWPTAEEARERIMRNWDTQYGDRETEMIFVGTGIDKKRLEDLLDGCLLQDEEMVFNNSWENFEDPFVEWVPLIEDDHEDEEPPVAATESQGAEAALADFEVDLAAPVVDTPLDETELTDIAPEVTIEQEDEPTLAEGQVVDEEVLAKVASRASALDVFAGWDDSDGTLIAEQEDSGVFEEDNAVIASWDSAAADDILLQVPRLGLPVTIVTGFLGSGKTTLLNYILSADHGLKIAVLVNEFGEIDIDSQLVETGDWDSGDEIMQLANGCICCTINESFVKAIEQILERAEKGEIDYLVVETTGVADPIPVIDSLSAPEIEERVRLDGVLTLVDAENFDPETNMGSEAALSQIHSADTILLSKTDVASKEKVEKTIEYVRSVRPWARILRSQRGRVPISMILDVGLRVADSSAHINPMKSSSDHEHEHEENHEAHSHHDGHDHTHEHDHAHDHECSPDCTHESHNHGHDHLQADGFMTTSFKSDQPLNADLFMKSFLQQLPEGVFRAKGLLRFFGYGQRYVFQLSGRRFQFEEDDWPEGVAPGNQLVVIGRNLDLEELKKTFEACLAQ